MHPIANTPVFLGLTADDDAVTRHRVATRALVVSAPIIIVFCAAGKFIFGMFGITLPAFRITGDILVALVGFHMLSGDGFPGLLLRSKESLATRIERKYEQVIAAVLSQGDGLVSSLAGEAE